MAEVGGVGQSEMQSIARMSPFGFRTGKGYIRFLHHPGLFLTFKVFGGYVKVLNGVI